MKATTAAELIGRDEELDYLRQVIEGEGPSTLVVFGPSGMGKTRLVEALCEGAPAGRFGDVLLHTIYRTGWTAALSQMKKHIREVPPNATLDELENALIEQVTRTPTLLVLDNVEETNVVEVGPFAEKWLRTPHRSALVLTAQDHVRAALPAHWPELELRGLTREDDILALMGDLRATLPVQELRQVGEVLDGNPQKLLFLRWLEPASVASLQESAAKLADQRTVDAVEDLVTQTSLSPLFFLALGVHKDLNIAEELLATLWDHFGSRGAEPFVRAKRVLTEMGFLAPTKPGSFRLHESVHVSLPKALRHRVGDDRIPSLHHYFAEYYRRMLHQTPTSTALTHFCYHAALAKDYRLVYETLIARNIAEELASQGTTLQVFAELTELEDGLSSGVLAPGELASVYLVLGRLCNDLSDHVRALDYMDRCVAQIQSAAEAATALQRDAWYVGAVAYSNTGQSDSCLRHYFKIVDSCGTPEDPVACLSLGYLAHDLKYRDVATAQLLGATSVEWARSFDSGAVLAKNLCSYAETLAVLGRYDEARGLFKEAETRARAEDSKRELGRILTNFGLAELVAGRPGGKEMIERGTEYSRSLGDRRRHFQGLLYGGVAAARTGERVSARSAIKKAADGFQSLNDGRYFVPAVLWLLQLDNGGSAGAARNLSGARGDTLGFLEHLREHPEFEVYSRFWHTYLSPMLARPT